MVGSMYRITWAAAGLTLSSMLLGSTCSPSEPGCEYGESCGESHEVTRACINFCVPVYTGTVVDEVPCALDECDEAVLLEHEIWRCPVADEAGQAYRCVPSDDSPEPGRIGVCRAARGLLDVCDPDEADTCQDNTYCLNANDCVAEAADRDRLGIPPDAEGYCWLPAREGDTCTGNLGRGEEPGCRPCEWGTWCRETPDFGPRCVRSCEDPQTGEPRPELCACSRQEEGCKSWDELLLDEPRDGEPSSYCAVADLPNGSACDVDGLPCEDLSAECQETTDPVRGTVSTCCRHEGDPCTSQTDCCVGSATCFQNFCTLCGRDGEEPTDSGCCPGTVVVEGTCRSCSVSREGRDTSVLGGASCEGEFVQIVGDDPDAEVRTFAVPVEGNTGAGVAEIGFDKMTVVRYELRPDHRLFLMAGDLTGYWDRVPSAHPPDLYAEAGGIYPTAGVTNGHRWVHLPVNEQGSGPREFDLTALEDPPETWQSMRVYHAGACSRFVDWDDLVTGISVAVNEFLVDPQFGMWGSTALTLVEANATPILASGTGPYGRSVDSDQVNLHLEYQALDYTRVTGDAVEGSAFGCDEGRIKLSLALRLVREPAVVATLDGELEDRAVTREHPCPADSGYAGSTCECRIDGDEYDCRPLIDGGISYRRSRDVDVLRDAFDFRPEIVFLDGGLVGCGWAGLNDLLTEILQGRLSARLPRVLDELSGSVDVRVPRADLGIEYWDLPLCGRTDPDTGEVFGSDAMCARSSTVFFGGRRPRCVGFDEDRRRVSGEPPAEYRCALLHVETQRINLRPDGLEIVLADSTADPQHPLLHTVHGDDLCGPERSGALPYHADPDPGTVGRAESALMSLLNEADRRICHPDDGLGLNSAGDYAGCPRTCGDLGVPCNSFIRTALGSTWTTADRCYVVPYDEGDAEYRGDSSCCAPSNFCPVPLEGGGRPFFEAASAPAAGRYWRCVSNMANDDWACGGCGNVCGAAFDCCDSACRNLDTDPFHCGACGNACAGGVPCLAGVCCGAGEVICAGACTDLSSDDGDCGSCGAACGPGNHCTNGECCPNGHAYCGGTCIPVLDDPANCGGCGIACEAGEHCSNGACCAAGWEECDGDGVCDNLEVDRDHCGWCGNQCAGFEACLWGSCA